MLAMCRYVNEKARQMHTPNQQGMCTESASDPLSFLCQMYAYVYFTLCYFFLSFYI